VRVYTRRDAYLKRLPTLPRRPLSEVGQVAAERALYRHQILGAHYVCARRACVLTHGHQDIDQELDLLVVEQHSSTLALPAPGEAPGPIHEPTETEKCRCGKSGVTPVRLQSPNRLAPSKEVLRRISEEILRGSRWQIPELVKASSEARLLVCPPTSFTPHHVHERARSA